MKPHKIIPIILTAGMLSLGTASAGTWTSDFSSYPSGSINGTAMVESTTNVFILTQAVNDQGGSLSVWDGGFNDGLPIESFIATFKLQVGPGTGNAADGTSFNFGANVNDTLISNEEGPGGPCLTIAFDIYDNGAAAEGHPTPSLDIRWQGQTIATHPFAKADMVTGKFEDVRIELKRSGHVSVTYKGQAIFTDVLVAGWKPADANPPAQFNISARTGGENAFQAIDDLTISTVYVSATPQPFTITQNPANVTVDEHGSAAFSTDVSLDGSAPFQFQWIKNNVDMPNQTNATLNLANIPASDNNAKFKVRISNAVTTLTSTEATLTVNKDSTAPTVVRLNPRINGTDLILVYSEAVSDTALNTGNYRINQTDAGTIAVQSITRVNPTTVILTTSPMPEGKAFVLTINGVTDLASSPPNSIAANTQVPFRSVLFQYGAVLHKKYNNMGDNTGWDVNNLFNDPRYPNFPDRQELMAMWEYPANGLWRDVNVEPDGAAYRNYYDTLEGYFMPATTGDYVFYACGADQNRVYLSTDADPVNKHLIASVSGWTDPRNWNVAAGDANNPPELRTNGLRSDFFTPTEWPNVDPLTGLAVIHLESGKRYYMESVHHDFSWSGGDDFAVTFTLVGEPTPTGGTAPALAGNLIGTYLDPTGATVTFTTQPGDANVLQGRTASFSAVVTANSVYGGSVAYQWQTAPAGSSTFTDIAGATKPSYTTPTLQLADTGRQYRLLATVPGVTEASRTATVTVSADTIAPRLVTASAMASPSGATFDVGVTFDEPVDAVSATTLANYSISSGTISAVKYYPQSPGVVLTVSGLTIGNSYTVTAANVKDPYNNAMASTPVSLTVGSMKWGVIGSDELGLGSGVLPVGPNSFDVYSDGIGEWAAYDEATFVYEQIQGDFDKEVRVEFQDASSQWARAGIVVRDVPNFGVNRATQQGANSTPPPWNGTAGRYQKVHVNPVRTAMDTPGNNSYECNRRLDTGSQTTGAGGGGTPAYPNAWCRIQRRGQTFNLFRSDDGVNWTSLGSTTWGVTDTNKMTMPDTVYVGLDYSPENGNVSPANLRSVFVAKYRDYRTHSDVLPPPVMTMTPTANGFTITYEGTLEVNSDLNNPNGWAPVQGAISPWPVTSVAGPPKFYRAKR